MDDNKTFKKKSLSSYTEVKPDGTEGPEWKLDSNYLHLKLYDIRVLTGSDSPNDGSDFHHMFFEKWREKVSNPDPGDQTMDRMLGSIRGSIEEKFGTSVEELENPYSSMLHSPHEIEDENQRLFVTALATCDDKINYITESGKPITPCSRVIRLQISEDHDNKEQAGSIGFADGERSPYDEFDQTHIYAKAYVPKGTIDDIARKIELGILERVELGVSAALYSWNRWMPAGGMGEEYLIAEHFGQQLAFDNILMITKPVNRHTPEVFRRDENKPFIYEDYFEKGAPEGPLLNSDPGERSASALGAIQGGIKMLTVRITPLYLFGILGSVYTAALLYDRFFG